MTATDYYKPSGRIAWYTPFRPLLTGLPWVVVQASVYAVVIHYNPFVYFSFLATLALGAAVGAVAVMTAQSARSRSHKFNAALGLFFGCAAVWAQWLVWLSLNSGESWARLLHLGFSAPSVWLDTLREFSEHWHVTFSRRGRGAELTPGNLHWIWGLEAAVIALLSMLVAALGGDGSAYSERSGCWTTDEVEASLAADDSSVEVLRARLEAEGASPLLALPVVPDGAAPNYSPWYTLKVSCVADPGDAEFCLIRVDRVTHTRKDNGKISTSSATVSKLRFLAPDDYRALVTHLRGQTHEATAQPNVEGDAPADPPELEPAIAALQAERFDEALELAEPHIDAMAVALKADALRVCGLAASRLERWAEAHARFAALFALEASAHNALQVATTAVMSGRIDEGKAWFDRAWALNLESHEIPPPTMHTSYATALANAGHPGEALASVEWLRDVYQSLPSTDSTFLHLRHLPFFSAFLEKSLPILRARLSDADVVAWYQAMRAHLDEDGRHALDAHVASVAA
ncbi:hypothetical protein [Niveibacterium sp.]|uniref:hypothetical protein n=1 Tax=Niveibacterium sp. TaxID=2017444 RepID=UPI0035AFA746